MLDSKLFELIVANHAEGVVVYDSKGDFLYVNPEMIRQRKISYDEYLGLNVHDFYDESNADDCVFDRVMKTKNIAFELQEYKGWGSRCSTTRLRLCRGVPIFDGAGNVQYVICYFREIENFQKMLDQLTHKKKLLLKTQETGAFGKKREQIIAKSAAMKDIIKQIDNIADIDVTVLFSGESGTGKNVLANYIHNCSKRKDAPFVEINCASFPENLLESELFGYEKGSFTGALSGGKKGLVEAAKGGTLFLDEINSLPLSLQGKFLSLLENKTFRRVGSNETRYADFRIIAATNRNLMEMVKEGSFRADLFYRLSVYPIQIPPLRERKEDIGALASYFIEKISEQYGRYKIFSQEAMDQLIMNDWPGNVRELKNFIERMILMTPQEVRVIEEIPEKNYGQNYSVPMEFEKEIDGNLSKEEIIAALQLFHGNRKKTAEYLSISLRTLQYKIKKFNLSSRCKK